MLFTIIVMTSNSQVCREELEFIVISLLTIFLYDCFKISSHTFPIIIKYLLHIRFGHILPNDTIIEFEILLF